MAIDTDPTSQFAEAPRARLTVGPCLYLQGATGDRLALVALLASAPNEPSPVLRTEAGPVTGREVWQIAGQRVLQFAFELPMVRNAWYAVDGARYEVNAEFDGDLRIAYVACNGQEQGDRRRSLAERNVLWRRLARQHGERPFQLLLQGGDQMYADDLLDSHPRVRRWADDDEDAEQGRDGLDEVAEALRRNFFRRYLEILSQPEIAWLMARVPSLAIWDDHDICDGWGSLRTGKLDAPVGRCLFAVAREHFLLFQLGAGPGELPGMCLDRTGTSLSWHLQLPRLHVIAPDLRSERRPRRVMGEHGWRALETALGRVGNGRVLLLSSVPALGPRLSWVEAVMHLTPGMQKHEDDLRDQWQSRAHRAEWRAFLTALARTHERGDVPITVLSGEIHLATRGTFDVPPAPIHQLVASGIAHPAPPAAYARALGTLARLGKPPLPEHRIRLHPLPGRKAIYTAQRNYLILERRDEEWRAWWELEEDGATPALAL